MLSSLKRRLYFFVAYYFRFFARLKLRRWSPKIIVVTGSAGKTTLLHLIEAQLGAQAHYSHHANSSYGIPFDILGLPGVQRSRLDWLGLFVAAPFKAFTRTHPQKLYVAEVDTDRPKEGAFLASLLKPDITLWVSLLHTHTAQFDGLVKAGRYRTPEDAIAADYGNLVAATKELVILNGDDERMVKQTKRTEASIRHISLRALDSYQPAYDHTVFVVGKKHYTLPALVPKATFYQVAMADELLEYLHQQPDFAYQRFHLPPGRSNVFKGIKGTTLIDSTYNNSNADSLIGVVDMFEELPVQHKWAVIGDLLEQGEDERREHQKVAEALNKTHFERLILCGPRVAQHTTPGLSDELRKRTEVVVYEQPAEVLAYLKAQLTGGEAVLFKGVRFLEGVIEALLADKNDAKKLPRREPIWEKRRKNWGL